ncbi:hypothetical protein ACJX0J_030595, partial [Zea mays]
MGTKNVGFRLVITDFLIGLPYNNLAGFINFQKPLVSHTAIQFKRTLAQPGVNYYTIVTPDLQPRLKRYRLIAV